MSKTKYNSDPPQAYKHKVPSNVHVFCSLHNKALGEHSVIELAECYAEGMTELMMKKPPERAKGKTNQHAST